jgi:hypothetical protein
MWAMLNVILDKVFSWIILSLLQVKLDGEVACSIEMGILIWFLHSFSVIRYASGPTRSLLSQLSYIFLSANVEIIFCLWNYVAGPIENFVANSVEGISWPR